MNILPTFSIPFVKIACIRALIASALTTTTLPMNLIASMLLLYDLLISVMFPSLPISLGHLLLPRASHAPSTTHLLVFILLTTLIMMV